MSHLFLMRRWPFVRFSLDFGRRVIGSLSDWPLVRNARFWKDDEQCHSQDNEELLSGSSNGGGRWGRAGLPSSPPLPSSGGRA